MVSIGALEFEFEFEFDNEEAKRSSLRHEEACLLFCAFIIVAIDDEGDGTMISRPERLKYSMMVNDLV